MPFPIDLARAECAAFQPAAEHETLARFAGTWRGLTRLWLDPAAPPEESRFEACAESLLGGRWLRLCTTGTALGEPHAGEMLLGYHRDERRYELAWIDSFHTGGSIMSSTGAASAPGVVDVLGSYAAGDERWGWRTRLWLTGSGELALDAFNISPDGVEARAVESRAKRA
jgi:hypothetical protein